MRIIIFGLLVSTFSIETYSQSILRVPSEWPTIQEAIDIAIDHDTILVAPGTYFENVVWHLKDLHLVSEKGKDSTTIDGGGTGRVIDLLSLPETSLLDGFTIQNGFSTSEGAGLNSNACALKLRNLNISNNRVDIQEGTPAAAYLGAHTGDIESCDFTNNFVKSANLGVKGVGLFLDPEGDLEIQNCTFNDNRGEAGAHNSWGAGMYIESARLLTFTPFVLIKNCVFSNNTQMSPVTYGAALVTRAYTNPSDLLIDSCQFVGNESKKGGAICFLGNTNARFNNCSFLDNIGDTGSVLYYFGGNNESPTIISNSIIKNNQWTGVPADKSVFDFDLGKELLIVNSEISHNLGYPINSRWNNVTLINTTMAYNELPIKLFKTNLSISESILWNTVEPEIEHESAPSENTIEISNSIIKGGFEGTIVIDDDPLFISEEILIPTEDSPCISAGDPALNVTTDLLGNPRPMPVGTNPDLGAYEVDQFISSTEDQLSKPFKVYPNPSHDWIFFSETVEQVRIHNSAGQLVKSDWNTNSINVKDLIGSYQVSLQQGNKLQVEMINIVR